MERKIGEIFEFGGEWYQCVVAIKGCRECSFRTHDYCTHHLECLSDTRSDKTSVTFKKLEKIGEPYISSRNKKRYQPCRCFCLPIITKDRRIEIGDANFVGVEIKQNKEDMEEYRMHDAKEDIPEFDKVVDECLFGEYKLNLKPFDLEAAKLGKPVCTRDGRKARIICFDAKDDRSIIALVESEIERKEIIVFYLDNGFYFNNEESQDDLMMLPEKKEGWVNVYKDSVYDTKDEALNRISEYRGYIDTIKINWSE